MFMYNQQQILHHKCTSTHLGITLKLYFSYQSFILLNLLTTMEVHLQQLAINTFITTGVTTVAT